MFTIQNLTYRGILRIEHLEIREAVTCIVGPSGSGKTTLLRMLNRLNAPDSGTVCYNGTDLSTMDAVALRREVVMMGQTPILYPGDMRDNLLAGVRFAGKKEPPDSVLKKTLERAGLSKPLSDPCQTLSGGERQRLCLGRILLMDAQVCLLDEPSAALDRETETLIVQNLVDFARKDGRQLVLVTHSENIVSAFQPAVVRLEQGRAREAAK